MLFVPKRMYLFPATGMKLKSSIIFSLLLLGVIDMTLAKDNSKVLMLDKRNLEGAGKDWGNGKDYSVTLAKDGNRTKLPSQFTICNSNFALGLINQGGSSSFWAWRIKNEDLSGIWMEVFGYFALHVPTKDLKMNLGIVVNGAWFMGLGSYGSLFFNRWHHFCIAVNLDREVLSIVAEGFAFDDLTVPGMRKGAPTKLVGRLILDDSRLTVSNYMVGNLQVFGRRLSKEEMVSIKAGTLSIFGHNKRTSWRRDPSEVQLSIKMVMAVKSTQDDPGTTEPRRNSTLTH